MPRIIDRIVRPQDRQAIAACSPEWTVLGHIGHDQALVLVRVRVCWIKAVVVDSRPAHAALAGAVDDASVYLAE